MEPITAEPTGRSRRQFVGMLGGGVLVSATQFAPQGAVAVPVRPGAFRADVTRVSRLLVPIDIGSRLFAPADPLLRARRWHSICRRITVATASSARRGLDVLRPIRQTSTEAFMESTGRLAADLNDSESSDLQALLSVAFALASDSFEPGSAHPANIWIDSAIEYVRRCDDAKQNIERSGDGL